MTTTTYQEATAVDLKQVDIASEMDWNFVKYQWLEITRKEAKDFEHIRNLLGEIRVLVGFGRGFWTRFSKFFYIAYSPRTDAFYWFLKKEDEDTEIAFYQIPDNERILELLKTKVIDKNFEEFNEAISRKTLESLAKQNGDLLDHDILHKQTDLSELFSEDSEDLRIALASFYPGALDNNYPHIEFQEGHFKPMVMENLKQLAATYVDKEKTTFSDKQKLFIDIEGEVFELTPVKTK